MPSRRSWIGTLVISLGVLAACANNSQAGNNVKAETKYLLFQIFTYPSEKHPGGAFFPPQGRVQNVSADIISRIGTTGDASNKLGICVGPLALNQSEKELHDLISLSFSIAKTKNIAIAFHIDDQMFWEGRTELRNKDCVEWIDWSARPCTGRRLDWGPKAAKAPPALCLNSPVVQTAVKQRAAFLGKEIAAELRALKSEGKEHLFAGVITGWETMIGCDFDTGKLLGYHALKNCGLDARKSKSELDDALVKTVREFIALWSDCLAAQGIPRNKIYCHLASPGVEHAAPGFSLIETAGYAPVSVAFDKRYRPGFSTYPDFTFVERLDAELARFGHAPWISAEGTNVLPNGKPGASTMETYLAERFNHGAVAVNIFSWGIGGEAEKDNFFRRATESDEALSAYRNFLQGKELKESKHKGVPPEKLRAKLKQIQSELPAWARRTGKYHEAESLMRRLDDATRKGDVQRSSVTADNILKTISAQ